jgi:hypothetical protein
MGRPRKSLITLVEEPTETLAPTDAVAPIEPPAHTVTAAPVAAAVAEPPPPAPIVEQTAAPALASTPPKFRVKTTTKVSWYGQVTTLRKGEIVDQAGYGAEGIARLRDGGADLEEIK